MRRVQNTSNWLRSLFRKKTVEQELSSELRFHIERQIEENVAAGMTQEEARRAATREFGGVEQIKEDCRDSRRVNLIETVLQDLRYGARMLRKNPGFTAVAVLTLVLGIGANTAIFSMVNALLLHPYDFSNLDSLVRVWETRGMDEGYDARWVAPADAADFLSGTDVFQNLTTYRDQSFNLAIGGGVEPVLGCRVSASFFAVLGRGPALGRGFAQNEERPGFEQVAVLGHGLWQRRFGGDPGLLGKTIKLNGRDYTVVGIMPPKFNYPVPSELWVPLALTPSEKADRTQLTTMALGRLKYGVTVERAKAVLASYSNRLEKEYPKTNAGRSAAMLQLRRELYLYTLPLFLLLQIAAAFVLLLACANLANLMFTRMIGRQKEIAMRTALGASARRLAQLFASETLLLSLLAGVAAVSVSFWSVRLLRTSISVEWTKWVPGWDGIQVNASVMALTILLAIAVGFAFGFATVLHTGKVNPSKTLKESGPGSLTRGRARLRSTLVVTQVVFALVLLVSAGLTIQGFVRLAAVYEGFQPDSVLKAEVALPENTYSDATKITAFYQQLLHFAAATPGVKQAALATNLPASNVDNETTVFAIEGRPAAKSNETLSADLLTASSDYFAALRIPLVAGRLFAESDNAVVERVAVISRSMAERFWPGEDVVGKRIKLGAADANDPRIKIVGVVGDIRQNWWNPAARPTIYSPFLQSPRNAMTIVLRVNANPAGYAAPLRDAVRQMDPGLALTGINTLKTEVVDSIGIIRILGVLMGVFGLVALALSSVGVYGVLSESVAQRTRELGIRLALGAHPRDLMKLVMGQALKLTGIGLAIAVPISFAVSRVMANVIFGVVTADFAVVAGLTLVLVVVALVAAYFPARRALRIDPLIALRYE
jgi:putative ABC transport system permease protein